MSEAKWGPVGKKFLSSRKKRQYVLSFGERLKRWVSMRVKRQTEEVRWYGSE
jgi:hypothetical protein